MSLSSNHCILPEGSQYEILKELFLGSKNGPFSTPRDFISHSGRVAVKFIDRLTHFLREKKWNMIKMGETLMRHLWKWCYLCKISKCPTWRCHRLRSRAELRRGRLPRPSPPCWCSQPWQTWPGGRKNNIYILMKATRQWFFIYFLKIWNKHMHKSIKQYPPHCSCSALTTRDNYLTVRTTNVKLEGDMRKKGEGAEVGTCSPLTSTTVNWSPKSLNTCAYKPFTSAMISWMPSQREDLPKIH